MASEKGKIRLLCDLPIDPKHGALAGNVYDAEIVDEWKRGSVRYWITGAAGEPVGVLNHEADLIESEEN